MPPERMKTATKNSWILVMLFEVSCYSFLKQYSE